MSTFASSSTTARRDSDTVYDRPQASYTPTSTLAVEVLQGKERVVCFPGTSQFRLQGVSACGLAAFNFARISFRIAGSCRSLLEALDKIASRETVEEVIAICAGWSSELHLEVEEISQIPLFEHTLKLKHTSFGPPKLGHFRKILQSMVSLQKSAAVIITRPPEIIACLKVTDANSEHNAYIVFDSHPRPSHPDGAGLIFSSSLDSAAKILRSILHVDKDLISSPDLQWEAQLLTNCSGHTFIAKNEPLDAEKSILESSLAVLALRAEVNELKQQNNALASQNGKLEEEVATLEYAVKQEKMKAARAVTYATALPRQEHKQGFRDYYQPNAVAGPSRFSLPDRVPLYHGAQSIFFDNPRPTSAKNYQQDTVAGPSQLPSYARVLQYKGAQSIFADNPPPVPTKKQSTYEFEDDMDMLEKMQIDFFKEDSKASVQDLNAAFKLQKMFDAEDAGLRYQQAELETHFQARFHCGICLEECPEDDAARVDGCKHMVCRGCMKGFITSKIAEHRFPILCPICSADNTGHSAAEISGFLVEQIGVTEEEYGIWVEMELSQFSILLDCRECNRSAFVDRDDYNDMPNIACPLPDCSHIWCKSCYRSIEIGGPKHSCDGTSELDHLMKEKGWRYCPNCKTPILKEHGCNHMACIASGCNSHFCYTCGDLIVRSALRDEVSKAVSTHYTKCQLFHVPD